MVEPAELNNANILLCSLAVSDLLVGAVSMPLTISLDALVLRRILIELGYCLYDKSAFYKCGCTSTSSFYYSSPVQSSRYSMPPVCYIYSYSSKFDLLRIFIGLANKWSLACMHE